METFTVYFVDGTSVEIRCTIEAVDALLEKCDDAIESIEAA